MRLLLVGGIFVDELAMNVAGVQIRRGDRHDRRRHQRADADCRERDAREPRRKAVQQQRGHRKVIAELLEAGRVFGELVHTAGDHEEAEQRQQTEHEGVAGQHGSVAADDLAAARAQYTGQRVRIKEQRECRA